MKRNVSIRDAAYALILSDTAIYDMLRRGELKGHLAPHAESQKHPSYVTSASLRAAIARRKGNDAVSHAERVRRLGNLK